MRIKNENNVNNVNTVNNINNGNKNWNNWDIISHHHEKSAQIQNQKDRIEKLRAKQLYKKQLDDLVRIKSQQRKELNYEKLMDHHQNIQFEQQIKKVFSLLCPLLYSCLGEF
jgi:hypothetical protein